MTATSPDFFDQVYLPCYTTIQQPDWARRDADFIVATLGLPAGARILDLCCGHGRHCLELARRGFAVTGLDRSLLALRQARAAAQVGGLDLALVQADMRGIPFWSAFDGCINWCTAFGGLENDEEDFAVLVAVGRALRPGGRFLLDTVNTAWVLEHFEPAAWIALPDGGRLVERRRFDPVSRRNHVEVRVTLASGSELVSHYSLRLYTAQELVERLTAAGFHVTGVWGGADASACSPSSRRLILHGEKVLTDRGSR
jgi:SAM-dependent methyltransferase